MAELSIRTSRHTSKIAAPPKRVYQLIANVDAWPALFGSVFAVEHIGFDGTNERVRFWGTFGDRRGSWVSTIAVNPKRLRVRFRREHPAAPIASLGGTWLVLSKGTGSLVVLDHYYRIAGDDPVAAQQVEQAVGASSTAMLASLRATAEAGGVVDMWSGLQDPFRDLVGVRMS